MPKEKIIITGATGFIGRKLSQHLIDHGYDVTSFSRDAVKSKELLHLVNSHVKWGHDTSDWHNQLEGVKAIVNLAGTPIAGKKWTAEYKQEIIDSRIKSTNAIVEAIKTLEHTPAFINASAIGYYGNRGEEILHEGSECGSGFLAEVTKKWEDSAYKANPYTRVVSARLGIILGEDGGALKKMMLPYNLFVGGPIGVGWQYMPWVHINDIVEMFRFVIENETISGPVNFVNPNPVTMNDFARELGKAMNRPSIVKVPEFMIKLILGESADMITGSVRVVPNVLLKNNYQFKFTDLYAALKDILK